MELALVKKWAKIDYDDDDDLVTLLQRSAEAYAVNAVGRYDDTDPLMRLLVLVLVDEYYKNRTYHISVNDKQSYTVRSIITQLQQDEYGGDE